jgi:nifR3 family TIM-barrel protein
MPLRPEAITAGARPDGGGGSATLAVVPAGSSSVAALLAASPIVLAPMEDVTDAAFRRICRTLGAQLCVTEFVGVEQVLGNSKVGRRRATLADDDRPTAIQIYGGDPDLLLAAAQVVAQARPAFVDLNCGCWVPRIVARNAGAAWLRDPTAMVAMARRIASAIDLPVTVKTRIGWGPESDMPIVDLARRLEDVGVAALAIHCRTAVVGHRGPADWSWARRAQEAVAIPVIVNGDVRTADDAVRALAETGCAAVMIGRAAIEHPWIFREARARLAGTSVAPPSDDERVAVYRAVLEASVVARGERSGVASAKRHVALLGPRLPELRPRLLRAQTLAEARVALGASEWLDSPSDPSGDARAPRHVTALS